MNNILGIGSRIRHADFGDGVIINVKSSGYNITFMQFGMKLIKLDYPFEIIEEVERDTDLVSLLDVEMTLSKVLQKWSDFSESVPLGDKWKGGKLILKPGRHDLANKEMPIDNFFHKIVMLRDRLRVMEQRINSSNLEDEEKLNLQQYITKIYGTLTSFNVLFKHQEHVFVGEKATVEA
ncbi:MAG: hypothetical protein MUF58_00395 [Arcicella sp.]|jgi:hypothetical protein|nr:hypothetical protein [Arcicella sp.]